MSSKFKEGDYVLQTLDDEVYVVTSIALDGDMVLESTLSLDYACFSTDEESVRHATVSQIHNAALAAIVAIYDKASEDAKMIAMDLKDALKAVAKRKKDEAALSKG